MENFIKELSKLISYKTVLSQATPEAPFGEENKNCLKYFLELAKSFGFETKNYDNYIGEVIYGEGQEIGIIGHLDVVPVGSGWETDPFTLTYKDGYYIGRGINDDKGPLLMSLYALKKLKDSGIIPKVKFRLICGTNEETGWKDVEYMKKVTTIPELGFSPDGNFPLTYAEKGMAVVTFKMPKLKNFYGVSGGTVINAVCDKAYCYALEKGLSEKILYKNGLFLEDGNKILSIGKSAHASSPSMGVNALNNLFNYFSEMGEDVKNFVEYVILDRSKLRNLQNEQGFVTLSPDLVYEKDDSLYVEADLRVPAPFSFDEIKKYLDTFNIEYSLYEKHPPFMADKECEFAKILLSSYKEVTKDESAKPLAMGGSTFARVFSKGYSFGLDKLDGELLNLHQSNEKMSEKTMKKAMEIYEKAIFGLSKGLK